MKCWNSSFNATRFESNYSSCTRKSSENICIAAVEGRLSKRERAGQNRMKLSLPPKKMVHFWVSRRPRPPHLEECWCTPFCKVFLVNLTQVLDRNSGFWCCVSLTLRKTPFFSAKWEKQSISQI
jgi:hypothetical protein